MNQPVITRGLKPIALSYENREHWLQLRKEGIGASDAAAACGVSKYKTPYQLWAEKVGVLQPDDISKNEAIEIGTLLEPQVAELYTRRTGRRVHSVNRILCHAEYPHIMASLDRSVYGENRPVELKTAGMISSINFDDWGEPGSSNVPAGYYLQCQQQAFVKDADVVDLAAMFGGRPFAIYEIPRNDEEISGMVFLLNEFWERVTRGREILQRMNATADRDEYGELEMQLRVCAPAASNIDDARKKFPREKPGASVFASAEVLAVVDRISAIKKAKSEHEKSARDIDKEVKALEGVIGDFMGENENLKNERGDVVVTYSMTSRAGYSVEPSEKRSIKIEKTASNKKAKAA